VRLREQRGMSQEDLAHAAKLSVKTISRLEKGGGHPGRPTTLARIAKALDVPLSDIATVPDAVSNPITQRLDDVLASTGRLEDTAASMLERVNQLEARLERLQASLEHAILLPVEDADEGHSGPDLRPVRAYVTDVISALQSAAAGSADPPPAQAQDPGQDRAAPKRPRARSKRRS
jgi:transcriptional regulator with XRE-family HTH domain